MLAKLFVLLCLSGLSLANTCALEKSQNCLSDATDFLLSVYLSKRSSSFTLEEKMEKTQCLQDVFKVCGGLDFTKNFAFELSKNTCEDESDCSDDGDSDNQHGNKYSVLHCLDDQMDYLIGVMVNSYVKAMENVAKLIESKPKQKLDPLKSTCSFYKIFVNAAEEMAAERCGEKARNYMRRYNGALYSLLNSVCAGAFKN